MRSKNPPSDPTKFSIFLSPSTAEWVREEAKERGVPMQAMIEACVMAEKLHAHQAEPEEE